VKLPSREKTQTQENVQKLHLQERCSSQEREILQRGKRGEIIVQKRENVRESREEWQEIYRKRVRGAGRERKKRERNAGESRYE